MAEKTITIPLSDSKVTRGLLRTSPIHAKKLIIFVHGLTGHKNEAQFYLGARFFPDKGFDTFRFDLYGYDKDERDLLDCDITTHSLDVNLVIAHFKNDYEKIFLVGHSLGAPSIVYSNQEKVSAVVLWDPSFKISETAVDEFRFDNNLDCYVVNWGPEFLLSKEMVAQWKSFDPEDYIPRIIHPTKFIFAGDGILKDVWAPYLGKISVVHNEVIVEGAGHCFQEDGKLEMLFTHTLDWFNKF